MQGSHAKGQTLRWPWLPHGTNEYAKSPSHEHNDPVDSDRDRASHSSGTEVVTLQLLWQYHSPHSTFINRHFFSSRTYEWSGNSRERMESQVAFTGPRCFVQCSRDSMRGDDRDEIKSSASSKRGRERTRKFERLGATDSSRIRLKSWVWYLLDLLNKSKCI